MIDFRLVRGILCFRKMLFQLNSPWISPIFPGKSLNLRKNPLTNFQDNWFFHSTRSAHIAKIPIAEVSPSSARISRIARTEAQDALFDYLHYTRSLQFTDADQISRNSPSFVQNLLSKVDNEQEIRRSLSRFLRYHPINEFEPFFESLGLKPSEISPLLPRDLMYLSDDELLLENFHVLCNYGIPCSKIGKMYKRKKEIFRYDYGVLGPKLIAYEKMGLSRPSVIKLVSCCPSLLIGGVSEDFVQVFKELKDLGIESDWIMENLSDKYTYHWNRLLGMLRFLNEMGCSESDFGRLIRRNDSFLFDDSGRKVYLLTAMLLKLGLGKNEILELLLQYPRILAGNITKNLCQAVHFLYKIGMETNDIANIVRSHPHVLGSCSLKTPQRLGLSFGHEEFCHMIKEDPHQLINFASLSSRTPAKIISDNDTFLVEKRNFLLKLGFVENSDEMMKALKKFRGRGDQLQERFDCLVNAGLNYHDVSNMIKISPPVLNQCKDVIEKKINYLVKQLGYPLESLVVFPTYLCYDLERINLRFSMYHWLTEKGAARPMVALSTILACSEVRFVKYVASLHPEGPEVWERLKKSSSLS